MLPCKVRTPWQGTRRVTMRITGARRCRSPPSHRNAREQGTPTGSWECSLRTTRRGALLSPTRIGALYPRRLNPPPAFPRHTISLALSLFTANLANLAHLETSSRTLLQHTPPVSSPMLSATCSLPHALFPMLSSACSLSRDLFHVISFTCSLSQSKPPRLHCLFPLSLPIVSSHGLFPFVSLPICLSSHFVSLPICLSFPFSLFPFVSLSHLSLFPFVSLPICLSSPFVSLSICLSSHDPFPWSLASHLVSSHCLPRSRITHTHPHTSISTLSTLSLPLSLR